MWRLCLSSLLLDLWAQNATVWHWVDTASQVPSPQTSPYYIFNDISFRNAVVCVLNDTVYIAGSYRALPNDPSNSNAVFSLPTNGTPPTVTVSAYNSFDSNSPVWAYLAAYDRRTGQIQWWMRFWREKNVFIRDMKVNPNTGTIYLLLATNAVANTSHQLYYEFHRPGSGGPHNGGFTPQPVTTTGEKNYLLEINPSPAPFNVFNEWYYIDVKTNLAVGSRNVSLRHLLWHRDTLYAVGDYEPTTPNPGKLIVRQNGVTEDTLFDEGAILNFTRRALIIAWSTATSPWTLVDAGEVSYFNNLLGTTRHVHGHRLAYDTTSSRLRWLIEIENGGYNDLTLYYRTTSGSLDSMNFGVGPPSFTPHTLLHCLSLRSNLSLPPPPNLHHLAFFNRLSPSHSSPHLFARGDSILWVYLTDDSAQIISGSTFGLPNGQSQLLLVRQHLSSSSNEPTLLSEQQLYAWAYNPVTGYRPCLSDVYSERGWEFLYLGGWGIGPVGPNGLPLGPNGACSGFLLGLRQRGNSYQPFGWRAFRSVGTDEFSSNTVLLAFAHDQQRSQFYVLGARQDSFLVERQWPDARNDTIFPLPNTFIPSYALWLGRLDWYRLETQAPSTHLFTECVPDSFGFPDVIRRVGTFQNSGLAPAESLYVWVPVSEPRYHPWQRIAYLRAGQSPAFSSSLVEGISSLETTPILYAEGMLEPGKRYVLTYPIWGRNHLTSDRWADVIDTILLQVQGTTIPPVGRATSTRNTFMVAPYAGSSSFSAPNITGPYPRYRREGWRFGSFISQLVAAPYHRQSEYLYVVIAGPTSIYRIDLRTGLVDSVPHPSSSPARLFFDPYRGDVWAYPGAMQLYRSSAQWPSEARWDSVFPFNSSTSIPATAQPAYPLAFPRKWLSTIHGAAVLPDGDIALLCADLPGARRSLWRIRFSLDSAWRVIGRYTGSTTGCPQDGTGGAAYVGTMSTFSRLAADGDTLYWLERPTGSCALTDQRALLRKAYPTDPANPREYTVTTIDTLRGAVVRNLLFTPVPRRALLFMDSLWISTSAALVRYDLQTKRKDTLIQDRSIVCDYGLSDFINIMASHEFALLRSGSIALSNSWKAVRLAIPIAIEGTEDTLRGLTAWTAASYMGPGHVVTPTYALGSDSLSWLYTNAPGPGLDSTYLVVGHSGCTDLKPFFYPFYWLPRFQFWISGPDTVCEGMVFHTIGARDTEVVEENCRVSHRLIEAPTGSSQSLLEALNSTGNESHRWRALASGYDTIRLTLTDPKWSYLVAGANLVKPIHIRRGHRLRLQVALEGAYDPATYQHRGHPFLTRYKLGAYNQRILGVTSDSLWRLPYVPGDSLIKNWNLLLIEGTCPGNGDWLCNPIGPTLAKVELRTTPLDPPVDSAYAVVDTMGHLLLYRAPLSSPSALSVGNADTLHFCLCDTTPAKYITVRFPHHLPLHTPPISLPGRGIGEADSLNLRDPSNLEGIPGEHYTFVPGPGGTLRAAAWAGNPADLHNAFVPGGPHVDAGKVNAADYEFLLPRNGIVSGGFSVGDMDCDGDVDAFDITLTLQNENALRESSRP